MGNGNAAAFAELDKIQRFLEAVPHLPEQAAPKVAEAFQKQTELNVAAGRNPYGDEWAPTKDGRAPLVNAVKAMTFKALGTVVQITLEGVEVMHHIGNARGYRGGSKKLGGFRRTLIPTGALPGMFRGAIRTKLSEAWQHLRHTEARCR